MGHLKERELSALADGELEGEALWRVEKHLEACKACRDALAEISAHDAALGAALAHDPGEAYFAGFADRVVGRIADAEKAGEAEAPARGVAGVSGDMLRSPMRLPWWQRPRSLALAGTLTAVVAAAGIVLLTSREAPLPLARSRSAAEGALQQSAPMREVAPSMPSAAPESAGTPGAVGESDQAARQDRLQVRDANGALTPAEQAKEAVPAAPRLRAPAASATPPPAAAKATALTKSSEPTAPTPASGKRSIGSSAMSRVPRGSGEQRAAPGPTSNFAAPPPSGSGKTTTQSLRDLKRAAVQPAGQKDEEKAAPAPASSAEGNAPAGAASSSGLSSPTRSLDQAAGTAASALEATRSVCGNVQDVTGRPLTGVAVATADGAHTARSDAQGRFCLDLPGGTTELQLMAVGFRPERIAIPATGELTATLHPLSVLDNGGLARTESVGGESRPPRVPTQGARSGPAGLSLGDAPLASLPDSLGSELKAASNLQARATTDGGASSWDAAAAAWERLLPAANTSAAEIELHARIAECRYHAWQRSGNSRRTNRAVEALTRYLTRAPAGERRSLAARWLDQVQTK